MKYKTYVIGPGHYILNVPVDNGVRNFYEGEPLPKNYTPPEDYINQKIVIEIKKGGSK